MRIAICGSISMLDTLIKIKEELESRGHTVGFPEAAANAALTGRESHSERADDKIKNDFIRKHYQVITEHDAILVVNKDKGRIKNYIGGNTFLEMGFAYILNKKIYCLHPLPDMPYSSELIAMQPVILNGNLSILDEPAPKTEQG